MKFDLKSNIKREYINVGTYFSFSYSIRCLEKRHFVPNEKLYDSKRVGQNLPIIVLEEYKKQNFLNPNFHSERKKQKQKSTFLLGKK